MKTAHKTRHNRPPGSDTEVDWASHATHLRDSIVVELRKSGQHSIKSIRATLMSMGLKRVGDVVILANNARNRGKVRRVQGNISISDPSASDFSHKLNRKKMGVMQFRNYENGRYAGRIATFKTTGEYASLEHYEGYSILAWTSGIQYSGILDPSRRFLINASIMHVFIGSDTVDPDRQLEADIAENLLTSDATIDFVRVNGGPEALSLTEPLEREVGISHLSQLSFKFPNLDQKRMLELLEDTGSPMVQAKADNLLRNLLVLKRPAGEA
ncbi:uL30 family ribosomal protein [Streptomyces sp. NBC_00829]|uniref:uL30 family ribosomal protein n=1 Tax=Streptomyces sp. NBC_00829 TaxID=2903679 RepID=UPI002F90DAB5